MDWTVIIVAAITAGIPALVTILTSFHSNRISRQNSAKQSILQLIMEDEFRYEAFKKLPKNHSEIQVEYQIYHDNGGNGEITSRVNDYEDWLKGIEKQLKAKRSKKK